MYYLKRIILLSLIVFVMVRTSFGGDSTETAPSVKTIYPSMITDRRVNICASIISNNGSVISRGFAVANTGSVPAPSSRDQIKYVGHDENDNYCITLRLYPGMNYTVWAYISTKDKTIYGNPVYFTTKP
jgi:hypothetical protein